MDQGRSEAREPGSDAAGLLEAFRRSQARVRAEEAVQIELAARFADLHRSGEEIDEFAVVEFAAAAGMSLDYGRAFLLGSVELVTRLPRIWARVRAGEVDGWRARRVAERTWQLSDDAAAWVDHEVAPQADKVGTTKLDRITAEALARFDPEAAAAEMEAALERRVVELYPDGPVTHLAATLDTADALDLDAAISSIAGGLDTDEPMDVRRSRALGILARGEAEPSREVVVHVHLTENESIAQVRSHTGAPRGLTTVDQVRDWCRDAARVTIKPVVDATQPAESKGYAPSDRVRDHVVELNETCAFPWCDRPSERLDLDHIHPYDPAGPPGQTTSANLAPLCRRHHRAKTFAGWRYEQIAPGEFLWTSVYGWQFLRTRDGTRRLDRPAASAA